MEAFWYYQETQNQIRQLSLQLKSAEEHVRSFKMPPANNTALHIRELKHIYRQRTVIPNIALT